MRKYWIYAAFFVLAACSGKPATPAQEVQTAAAMPEKSKAAQERKDICWSGTLAQKVPVFIHYQVSEDIVSGTITYLNTKSKTPIRLIGTIASDGQFRLLEFEASGNITGIITGQPGQQEFSGSWFSPRTRKSLDMQLVQSDSLVEATAISAAADQLYGDYHYQYSEDGPRGDFSISSVDKDRAAFQIFSVTSDPARNMADVGTDTVKLSGTSFIYKIPDTDSCEFKVRCYKDFVHIDYTRGYCDGQFGHNATIEGIFLKVAK
jgi:hypothetical protein